MFSTLYGIYFPFWMHFKMSSRICSNLDQSKFLSYGNGLSRKSLHVQGSFYLVIRSFVRQKGLDGSILMCYLSKEHDSVILGNDRVKESSIIKSRPQSFRHSLKFHSKCKCLMTWSIHPGHWMLATIMKFIVRLKSYNQSVENAGIAFVKGDNERKWVPWKNRQTVMYNKQGQTNKAKD